MRISFCATKPRHMWPTARAVAQEGALGVYYSGSPARKLADAGDAQLRCSSVRTTVVEGFRNILPQTLHPGLRRLFRWRDRGFDRWVATRLEACDFIHAMPGEALETFGVAKRLGIRTVLNHATGPAREWVRIMRPEYERAGAHLERHCRYDDAYFAREEEEYALADFHCVPSTLVRDEMAAIGIPGERLWLVPCGGDTNAAVFHRAERASPPPVFRILFVGRATLAKGIHTLLDALASAGHAHWKMEFLGPRSAETARVFRAYRGATPLSFVATPPDEMLARTIRDSSVLVLPSLEEARVRATACATARTAAFFPRVTLPRSPRNSNGGSCTRDGRSRTSLGPTPLARLLHGARLH
jgi:glycosyltransferase involved in cell wall biosynthesis